MDDSRAVVREVMAAEQRPMSPQETKQQKHTGLFAGKIHFSFPSAESPFAFPSGAKTDGEDVAFLVAKKDDDNRQ